ncbi:hypothetical protein [Burkholderia gladioli]|uniref:hypothetical protein n=1 Tax=Burkholderia gladioli TaxID=28095 RepID=UPI0012D2AF67|nr:hypothetical protein [Burkholderia gladioli]
MMSHTTAHERDLIARLNDCNTELTPADRHGLVVMIERLWRNAGYVEAEREHLGDPNMRTGIYAGSGKIGCTCECCMPQDFMNARMILCAKCGNKRCPHATDHRNACTNSNEPGQKGSSWENVKPFVPSLPNERDGEVMP